MNTGIYTITNMVNGKMYVGCSISMLRRKVQHLASLRRNIHKNPHLQYAWNKYGEDKFLFEVLVECEEEHLYSVEHWWCNMLQVHNREYGYNEKPTHPYGTPRMSDSMRKKLSISVTGRKHTPETLKILSERKLGRKQSKEYIEKRISKIRGRKQSREEIERRTIASKKAKEGIVYENKSKKAIVQYTINNVEISRWESSVALCKYTKYNPSDISEACNNKRKGKEYPNIYKGYKWSFINK